MTDKEIEELLEKEMEEDKAKIGLELLKEAQKRREDRLFTINRGPTTVSQHECCGGSCSSNTPDPKTLVKLGLMTWLDNLELGTMVTVSSLNSHIGYQKSLGGKWISFGSNRVFSTEEIAIGLMTMEEDND